MARNICDVETIKKIWDYYQTVDPKFNNYVVDEMVDDSKYTPYDFKTFNYMIDLLNYNSFPAVVRNDEYAKSKSVPLYRGVESPEHNAQTLADFDYHRGIGVRGCGLYASMDFNEVYTCYANDPYSILEFKLDSGSYLASYNGLRKILNELISVDDFDKIDSPQGDLHAIYDFIKSLPNNDRAFFIALLDKDPSKLAMLLGYDAVDIDFHNSNHTIVLNRGKMVVSESEYKRKTDLSRYYKGGFVDENKPDENFLLE